MSTKERNKEIVKMSQSGMSRRKIAEMYGVTSERIRQVLRDEDRKQKMMDDDGFGDLWITSRNALKRKGIRNKDEFIKFFNENGADEVFKIKNVGMKTIKKLEEITGLKILGSEALYNEEPVENDEPAEEEIDAKDEIARLKRIIAKFEMRIRKLQCKKLTCGFFEAWMVDSDKESYEVGVKVLIDGEEKTIPLLKAPNTAELCNQVLSMKRDVLCLFQQICGEWNTDN